MLTEVGANPSKSNNFLVSLVCWFINQIFVGRSCGFLSLLEGIFHFISTVEKERKTNFLFVLLTLANKNQFESVQMRSDISWPVCSSNFFLVESVTLFCISYAALDASIDQQPDIVTWSGFRGKERDFSVVCFNHLCSSKCYKWNLENPIQTSLIENSKEISSEILKKLLFCRPAKNTFAHQSTTNMLVLTDEGFFRIVRSFNLNLWFRFSSWKIQHKTWRFQFNVSHYVCWEFQEKHSDWSPNRFEQFFVEPIHFEHFD